MPRSKELIPTRNGCLPKQGTNKENMHEWVCLSMGLTRQACMKRGSPKHETNKENMHVNGLSNNLINKADMYAKGFV